MREDRANVLTNGFLPTVAFQHLRPTAVGVVDLDRSIVPNTTDGRSWSKTQTDGLLLVRLHGEPLVVVYIDRDPGDVTDDELAASLWRSAGQEIRRHVERYQCVSMPRGPDALVNGLAEPEPVCSGAKPTTTDASVAVIIPTAGREKQLERCLRSLLLQRRSEFEVLVIDNRPAVEETRRIVAEVAVNDARVRYVPEWRTGSSVARNRGISETNAELVAFTDDDVVVDPSWLEWLLAPFAQPAVTASCGMVLPLELETEAQKRFEQYGGFSKGVERRSYEMGAAQGVSRLLYPFLGDVFGSGNSMAFRRAELVAAGGFDPALGGGSPARAGEDIYAFSTAILRGGRIVYEPRALCWHEHRKESGALRGQMFDYGLGLGAIMTKALSTDARFYPAAARSLPIALRLWRQRRASLGTDAGGGAGTPAFPRGLAQAQRAGMLRGPARYLASVIRAHRLRLRDVIREDNKAADEPG
jgi:O-antigen biosynthesis protein